jgi:D-alanyl-D-alanine carboxypeptidase/D-alanyl-D-alanine-endopeptidase (penicillin-binding protein 4)
MIFFLVFGVTDSFAQTVRDKLTQAVQQMEADTQLVHAIVGFAVYDSKTDTVVYEHNAQIGLAPASTQKIFTSCAAFDLLGPHYRYKTEIGYKYFNTNPSRSYFVIKPSGDPTFGSSRFDSTKAGTILENIITSIRKNKITPVSAQYSIFDSAYGNNTVPGGWIWEDIGNYYGASAQSLNWLENQYDIVLKSGKKPGDNVAAVQTRPAGLFNGLRVNVKSAGKGSGDNSIVFLNYGSDPPLIEGTIPVGEDTFAVSASIPDPQNVFIQQLNENMKAEKIAMFYGFDSHPPLLTLPDSLFTFMELYKQVSPPLDSINYWFLKKSINLYGEALIKTMAFEKSGFGSTEKGVELLKEFWSDHDIEKSALNICDGSGLSPQNRVTTNALVKALQYARTRPWFKSFYYALPEHNDMKMKSGSINGVKAYAGYHKASDGKEYTYAIIINNYDGKSADVVKKKYKLLDNLK